MAETSDQRQIVEEPEELRQVSSAERDQWESTELSEFVHIRRNYTHASSAHVLGPGSTVPTGLFGHLTYNVQKFWRRQISVTVDHVTCRDHLGTYHYFLSFTDIIQTIYPRQGISHYGIRRFRAELLLSSESFVSSTYSTLLKRL